MGLLDPATSDGRVIFFLPWQGNTIAGTTDSPCAVVEREPRAAEEEIRWVLEEVRRYLSPDIQVRRGDVLSAWSGLRPLVRHPGGEEGATEGLVRSHVVHVSQSGLVTIAGGKWTTYREMAKEGVDVAIARFGLKGRAKRGCATETLRLVGSDGWSRNMFIGLIQRVRWRVSLTFLQGDLRSILVFAGSMDWKRRLHDICRRIMGIARGLFALLLHQPVKAGLCMEDDCRRNTHVCHRPIHLTSLDTNYSFNTSHRRRGAIRSTPRIRSNGHRRPGASHTACVPERLCGARRAPACGGHHG